MTLPTYFVAGIAMLSGGSTAAACLLWQIKQGGKATETLCRQILNLIQRQESQEEEQRQRENAKPEPETQQRHCQRSKPPSHLSKRAAAGN